VVALLPLLPAALLWRGFTGGPTPGGLPVAALLGLLLLPRVALAVRDLWWEDEPWRWRVVLRGLGGLALMCLSAAFLAQTSLDALGLGTAPPTPTLGLILAEMTSILATLPSPVALVAPLLLAVALGGPWLLGAWAVLRPVRRAPTLAMLLG
jgi:hypothetical protein